MRRRDIISMYASGLCELVLIALGTATAGLIALQLLAAALEVEVNAGGALLFAWQIHILMALWPGQTFWTIRRTTPAGEVHSIIGMPSNDDWRVKNRRNARRISNSLRD